VPVDRHVRLRQVAFVGINLCALVALYAVVVRPMLSLLAGQADRLTEARSALARYRAVSARTDAMRDAADRASQAGTAAAFLAGTSDGAINAGLQARLKTMADQAGARVQSIRALEPTTHQGIRYFGAHVDLAGPIATIHATLQAIEGREPYLFVDAIHLRMPAAPPGIVTAQEPSLEAQVDIHGPVSSHVAAR